IHMNESRPSLSPGDAPRSGRAETGGGAPSAPSALPPVAATRAKTGCGCDGAAAAPRAASGALPPAFETASRAAPSLRPGSAGAAVAATWQSNVHLTGLWSINQDRNCWAHLDTVGWRGLSGVSESGLVSLNMLAAHAFQQGAIASCYEGDD